MRRWELILLQLSALAVALSGLAYGVMKYALTGTDPDSPLGHPWQPGALKAHVVAAPFLVFALGIVTRGHALFKWRSGETTGRRSGLVLLAFVAPLVLSGYAVQAFTGELVRKGTGWGHAAAGAVFAVAYLVHLLKRGTSTEPDV